MLLLMDSLTRVARSTRSGLAIGEPQQRRDIRHQSLTFAKFDRASRDGWCMRGFISAFYTVLAENDDRSDPISIFQGRHWTDR